jgi:hypothetical protein
MMRNTPGRPHAERESPERSCLDAPGTAAPLAETGDDQSSGWAPLLGLVHHVDQRWVRHVNRALVFACIREHGPLSRVEIVARTDLSRAAVSAITSALLRDGVIREGGHLPSSTRGGRPAVLLHMTTRQDDTAPPPTMAP